MSRTSRAFSLKIARISFSSAVSSVSPLGVTLPDQQVARAHLGADADDAAVVEIAERLLRAVGDVAGDLLVAQLRGAGVDLVLLDVDRGELVVLDETLGDDDRVLEVVALPGHEGHQAVLAQRQLTGIGRGAVREDLAPLHLLARTHQRLLVEERALVGAHELLERVLVAPVVRLHDDALGVHVLDRSGILGQHHVTAVDRGADLHAGADQRRLGLEQRHGLALHVRAHQRAVGVVVLEERDQRRGHRPDLVRRHIHQVNFLRRGEDVLALPRPAGDLGAAELVRLGVELRVRLGDHAVLFLRGVEVDHLVGHDALVDHPVGRGHEPVLRDLGVARQRADQADVRALRSLDRAHAAVVGGVHVAHLDGRALTRQAAGAEGAQPPAMREAVQRVGLGHELAQLGAPEELLLRGHDRPDVDDRLRRDRVRVLGGEALAHHALHPVEPDPERLLDQLAHRAQTAVAEVLVLVEMLGHRLARHGHGLGGEVLDRLLALGGVEHARLRDAQHLGERDELLDQLDDVPRGERAGVERLVDVQPAVQLVAPDAREVIALGIEEELVEQVLGRVDRGRLARTLLLEQLDQRAFLGSGDLGVGVEGQPDVEAVLEQLKDLLVAARPGLGHEPALTQGVAHRPKQHRDRQLALAVDADEDACPSCRSRARARSREPASGWR